MTRQELADYVEDLLHKSRVMSDSFGTKTQEMLTPQEAKDFSELVAQMLDAIDLLEMYDRNGIGGKIDA